MIQNIHEDNMTFPTLKNEILRVVQRLAIEIKSETEVGENPLELSEKLIIQYGWNPFRDILIQILNSQEYQELWQAAILTLYGGIRDGKPLEDENYFIALMYACLKRYPGNEPEYYYDSVWSLVMTLKKVGITSDYEPLEDQAIKPIFQSIMEK